jgi:uncharacterized membrane protein
LRKLRRFPFSGSIARRHQTGIVVMTKRMSLALTSLVIAFALTLGAGPEIATAQQKKAAGAGKHQACLAKARAENPDRAAGHARQAAFNRCMGR